MSKTYNESLTSSKPRGFNTKGQETPEGAWNTRVYLRQVVGLYWDIDIPGSRTLALEGTGAIILMWGKGFPLQVKYQEQHYTTVFTDIGRYDLTIKGDVHLVTKFSNIGHPSLCGTVKGYKNMESLTALELYGGHFTGELDVSACPLVTLAIPDSPVSLNFDTLPTTLTHIDLRGANGVTGDLSTMHNFIGLRYLDVSGSSLTYDVNAPSSIATWTDGIHLALADIGLTGVQLFTIVNMLVDSGIHNGYLDISGTNADFPTEEMYLVDALRSDGWTVYCNPLVLGQSYYGGVIAYIYQAGDIGYVAGEVHGIIVAPPSADYVTWSNVVDESVNGTLPDIGKGALNTGRIIAQAGHTTSAAKYCNDYVSPDGYADFFLPSTNELLAIAANGAFLGFVDGASFWSSTETDYPYADAVRYSVDYGAYADSDPKSTGDMNRALPVRYF